MSYFCSTVSSDSSIKIEFESYFHTLTLNQPNKPIRSTKGQFCHSAQDTFANLESWEIF